MAVNKKEMSSKLNEILPIEIDWTRLKNDDLKKVYEFVVSLEDMMGELVADKADTVMKSKAVELLNTPGDNTLRGILRNRINSRMGLQGGKQEGATSTPILDALRSRVGQEILSADTNALRDFLKKKAMEQSKAK